MHKTPPPPPEPPPLASTTPRHLPDLTPNPCYLVQAPVSLWAPRRGASRVSAGAGGVCVVVLLSPPVLRIGLRWPTGSGDDPAECACLWQEVDVLEACAWLLCWLVLCGSWAALSMVPDAWSVCM